MYGSVESYLWSAASSKRPFPSSGPMPNSAHLGRGAVPWRTGPAGGRQIVTGMVKSEERSAARSEAGELAAGLLRAFRRLMTIVDLQETV